MAITCPKCNAHNVKISKDNKTGEIIKVHCAGYNIVRNGEDYINAGDCEFVLWLKQEKSFGRNITLEEAKRLIAGETIRNKAGDKMTLDISGGDSGKHFTKIERAEAEDL